MVLVLQSEWADQPSKGSRPSHIQCEVFGGGEISQVDLSASHIGTPNIPWCEVFGGGEIWSSSPSNVPPTWLITSLESEYASRFLTPTSRSTLMPAMRTLYSNSFSRLWRSNLMANSNSLPQGVISTILAPLLIWVEESSMCNNYIWSSYSLRAISAMNSASVYALITFLGW